MIFWKTVSVAASKQNNYKQKIPLPLPKFLNLVAGRSIINYSTIIINTRTYAQPNCHLVLFTGLQFEIV